MRQSVEKQFASLLTSCAPKREKEKANLKDERKTFAVMKIGPPFRVTIKKMHLQYEEANKAAAAGGATSLASVEVLVDAGKIVSGCC